MTYTGRFAPSPTGPLHLGSLVAAVGSYLDAKANGGYWLLRMEDLDPPREMPESKSIIPKQLENHGLYWDQEITYQSDRLQIYQDYLDKLEQVGAVYLCDCSRQRIKTLGGNYDGLCRENKCNNPSDCAVRVHISKTQRWTDLILGEQQFTAVQLHGDFVVKRRDGLFSYQLAVAIDDALQNITHVIRGADLLDSTARQIHIQGLLELDNPLYGHLPIITDSSGAKLCKQHQAPSLDTTDPTENLFIALQLLGQQPDPQLREASTPEILSWGQSNWNRAKISLESKLIPHIA